MKKGFFNLVQYQDSSYNISNALQTLNQYDSEEVGYDSGMAVSVSIRKILIQHIELNYDQKAKNLLQSVTIIRAKANLDYNPDSLGCDLDVAIKIDNFSIGGIDLKGEDLQVDTDLLYDQNEEIIKIHQGNLKFRNANLLASVVLDISEKSRIDLVVEANDSKLQFTKLFLSAESKNNLENGRLYLTGRIKGPITNQLPEIDVRFGANDLRIKIPDTDEYLYDFDLNGHFYSGKKDDLSEAKVEIDTLNLQISSGEA